MLVKSNDHYFILLFLFFFFLILTICKNLNLLDYGTIYHQKKELGAEMKGKFKCRRPIFLFFSVQQQQPKKSKRNPPKKREIQTRALVCNAEINVKSPFASCLFCFAGIIMQRGTLGTFESIPAGTSFSKLGESIFFLSLPFSLSLFKMKEDYSQKSVQQHITLALRCHFFFFK